jgi:hypothetical protein
MIESKPRRCNPTRQQQRFADIYLGTDLTLTDAYRMTYPAHRPDRSPQAEWVAASRMLRSRGVIHAIENRAILQNPEQIKNEALAALGRITAGELDASCTRAALRQLREASRAIKKRDALARSAERDLEQRREREARRQAWRMFIRAATAVRKDKRNGRPPLSPEERAALIFAHFAPIVPAEPAPPPPPPAPADAHLSELHEHIHVQQQALEAERMPVPSPPPAEPRPEPGCFPHPIAPGGDDLTGATTLRSAARLPAGEWIWVPVPGAMPARRKRVWVPAEEGEL